MYLVITRDLMLLNAVVRLLASEECVHIRGKEDICEFRQRYAKVIIDTLMNNVFHTALAECLARLHPERVIIMSPFGIRKLFPENRVIFISRHVTPEVFCQRIISEDEKSPGPSVYFTRKQHRIVSQLFNLKNNRRITDEMNISPKTLLIHKYNIMLLLNIRKFCHLLTHPYADFFRY